MISFTFAKPKCIPKIEHKQEQQKLNHDKKAVERTFAEGRKSMQEIILALVISGCQEK